MPDLVRLLPGNRNLINTAQHQRVMYRFVRFAPAIQPFSLLLKFLKAAGGLMQAECPAWGWETDWQVPGGYAGKAALHLVNELRLQRAQSGPHLQKDRTGWKENHNTSVRDQRNAFFARGDATPRMGPLLKESFPANA